MQARTQPAIIVHGGAGDLDPGRVPRCIEGCEAAVRAGWAVLDAGGAAVDAVEAAVRVLEDDGEFNAGFGAALNRDGVVEVDAALFDGALRGGGVGAVPWLRHPITLARRVMEEGRHLLLVGEGALAFAREHGIRPDPPEAMVTPRSRARFEKERAGLAAPSGTGDTVGAVAVDARGRLAAGSSTGGTSSKRAGRIGDSPIPGAGLYALDGAGAATATGHGESIWRALMSRAAIDALRGGRDPEAAARAAVEEVAARTGGTSGIVVVDPLGRVGQARSTSFMPWASVAGGVARSGV